MPLRITILSGDRQGQQLEFDQQAIEIGDRPADDIGFDVATNPGIRDRRATLHWKGGSWHVIRSGTMPIFLNHVLVEESNDLKSGDILRMSHEGPDLSCEFIGKLSPVATVISGNVHSTQVASTNDQKSQLHEDATAEKPVASPTNPETTSATTPKFSQNQIISAVATLGLLVIVMFGIQWAASRTSQPALGRPSLVPFGVLVVKEGEQLFWRPTMTQTDPRDRFALGDEAPPEMTIDESTGTVRWQTTEADGPGEYRCELIVSRGDADEQRDSQWLEIKVDEVNRAPQIEMVPVQTVNLLDQNAISLQLSASDDDLPSQTLTFRLGAGAPAGAELNSETGLLTWQADDQSANSEIVIPFQVNDGSGEPGTQGAVRVRVIKPDPWQLAAQRLRECTYFVVTETSPGKLLVPLGTACAIDENHLLTTGSVAHGINDARGRGWKVMAADTRNFDLISPQGLGITEVQMHAAYVKANAIEDPQQRDLQQAFFDISILTTQQSLPKFCTLANLETTVKNDQTVACYGFAVEGDSLSQFDSLEPQLTKIKLIDVVPLPSDAGIQGRPPLLLQLLGKLPFQPFGSLIINDQAELLGIYAFQGDLPNDIDSDPIHYAVENVHAQAYLNKRGLELWVKTEPTKPRAENQ